FRVDQRERDRNPDLAIENVVQKAIPRVVIVFAVSREAELAKEKMIESRDPLRRRVGGKPLASPLGEIVEAVEIPFHVARRVLLGGDPEGGFGQRYPPA